VVTPTPLPPFNAAKIFGGRDYSALGATADSLSVTPWDERIVGMSASEGGWGVVYAVEGGGQKMYFEAGGGKHFHDITGPAAVAVSNDGRLIFYYNDGAFHYVLTENAGKDWGGKTVDAPIGTQPLIVNTGRNTPWLLLLQGSSLNAYYPQDGGWQTVNIASGVTDYDADAVGDTVYVATANGAGGTVYRVTQSGAQAQYSTGGATQTARITAQELPTGMGVVAGFSINLTKCVYNSSDPYGACGSGTARLAWNVGDAWYDVTLDSNGYGGTVGPAAGFWVSPRQIAGLWVFSQISQRGNAGNIAVTNILLDDSGALMMQEPPPGMLNSCFRLIQETYEVESLCSPPTFFAVNQSARNVMVKALDLKRGKSAFSLIVPGESGTPGDIYIARFRPEIALSPIDADSNYTGQLDGEYDDRFDESDWKP